jgi:hypothetical protein
MCAALPWREAVVLNVTEGRVNDLLYLPFHIGAKPLNQLLNFRLTTL